MFQKNSRSLFQFFVNDCYFYYHFTFFCLAPVCVGINLYHGLGYVYLFHANCVGISIGNHMYVINIDGTFCLESLRYFLTQCDINAWNQTASTAFYYDEAV